MGACEMSELPSVTYYSLAQINPNARGQIASRKRRDLAWQIDYLTKLHNRVPDSRSVFNALVWAWQAKASHTRSQGDTRGMGICAKALSKLNREALEALRSG